MAKITPYIPFFVFFLAFFALLQPIELLPGSDDTAHFEMLEKLGVGGWLAWRAGTWEPRLFSDFFYAIFINNLALWRLVNAIVAALLVFGVWRLSFGPDFLKGSQTRKNALLLAASLICLLFFFIFPNAVTSSSIWFTGSFNYLWPVTAMIFGLTPFLFFARGSDPYPKKIWIPIGIFASLCAGFTLQTTLVSFGAAILIIVFCFAKKRKIPVCLIIHFAVITACAVYFVYGTLTSSRLLEGEEIALFPEFATFGLRDKLQLGIHVFDTHLLRSSSLLFFTLALVAGILAYTRLKSMHFCFRIVAFFPSFYILLNMLPMRYILSGTWLYQGGSAQKIGMPSAFDHDPSAWFDFLERVPPLGWGMEPRDLFMAAIALAAVLFMVYPLFFAFRQRRDGLIASLIYLASFSSGVIMGFSPTVFASGSRPFFLSNILLLLLCAMLVREGMTDEDPRISDGFHGRTKVSKLAVAAVSLVAVYSFMLYKFVFASVFYWWY